MPNDPAVQLALVGILTTVITTAGVVLVAVINNRRERTSSADEGITSTLRERITLKDESIQELKQDKVDLMKRLDRALEEVQEARMLNRELTKELRRVKGHK